MNSKSGNAEGISRNGYSKITTERQKEDCTVRGKRKWDLWHHDMNTATCRDWGGEVLLNRGLTSVYHRWVQCEAFLNPCPKIWARVNIIDRCFFLSWFPSHHIAVVSVLSTEKEKALGSAVYWCWPHGSYFLLRWQRITTAVSHLSVYPLHVT